MGLNSVTANQPKKGTGHRPYQATEKQDARSLDDQVAYCRDWVEKKLNGPFEYIIEKSQGSGENLERPELETVRATDQKWQGYSRCL